MGSSLKDLRKWQRHSQNLTRKKIPFQWKEEQEKAFNTLKEKLTNATNIKNVQIHPCHMR